jgi:hypothetical protein
MGPQVIQWAYVPHVVTACIIHDVSQDAGSPVPASIAAHTGAKIDELVVLRCCELEVHAHVNIEIPEWGEGHVVLRGLVQGQLPLPELTEKQRFQVDLVPLDVHDSVHEFLDGPLSFGVVFQIQGEGKPQGTHDGQNEHADLKERVHGWRGGGVRKHGGGPSNFLFYFFPWAFASLSPHEETKEDTMRV